MMYDIVIVGGGMVGGSLAHALRNTTLKILLVDAATSSHHDDPRLIALNHHSCQFFESLGLWQQLHAHAAAIETVHVSQRKQFGITRLHARDFGLSALGHVVPAKYINAALYDNLNQDNLTLLKPATLKNISQTDAVIFLDVEMNTEIKKIKTNYLVGADGTHSTVRELMNFATESFDYQQSALVTITELQRSHHHIAYERFHESGAIAMLPLMGNRVATIWTDASEKILMLQKLSGKEFLDTLQQQFGYRLGRLCGIEKRFVFPLQMQRVQQLVKNNIILLGNAAHTLHPIAAQGLNLALYETRILIERFSEPVFDQQKYCDLVMPQINHSMNMTHRLTQIFSTDFFGLNMARSLSMLGMDVCLPVKKYFAKQVI